MINFSRRYINCVSFIISIIIMFILNSYNCFNLITNSNDISSNYQIKQENTSIQVSTKEVENKNTAFIENQKAEKGIGSNAKETSKKQWIIEIPIINLKAEIAEGTSKEIMDKYVGHFEETQKENGNVGLAAHNRGYKVNYFQDLKKLKEGDEILYSYNGVTKKYKVESQKIISDEDWTLLENTEENKLTLITCVENQPEYRRCIQAIQIK